MIVIKKGNQIISTNITFILNHEPDVVCRKTCSQSNTNPLIYFLWCHQNKKEIRNKKEAGGDRRRNEEEVEELGGEEEEVDEEEEQWDSS